MHAGETSIRLIIQVLNIPHQISHPTSPFAILPSPPVPYTAHLALQANRTACRGIHLAAVLDGIAEQVDAVHILVADAAVDLVEVQAVLEGAVLDEAARWNVRVVGYHAIGEAEVELRRRVEVRGAEEDDVAEAFGRAMHTGDGVGVGVDTG
jgi:hypothetical protein